MYSKYADRRVYQHFVHTYSCVPYIDRQIFNIGERSKVLKRQAGQRANSARQGLQRINEMADQLEKSIQDSRQMREKLVTELKEAINKDSSIKPQKQVYRTPPKNKHTQNNQNLSTSTPKQRLLTKGYSNSGTYRQQYCRYY